MKQLAMILITMLVAVGIAIFATAEPAQAADKTGYMELDPIVVEGQIQRPEAAYIIQRANLEFGITAKKRSFIGKIVKTIDEAPF